MLGEVGRVCFGFCGGGVVLERLVVRDVIRLVDHRHRGSGAPAAAGGSVGILNRQVEAAFEEAPADAGGVQQVADIGSAHVRPALRWSWSKRLRLGPRRSPAYSRRRRPPLRLRWRLSGQLTPLVWPEIRLMAPVGRGTKVGAVGVVTHGEPLRIIPECGHGVAVVVAHHQPIRRLAIGRRTGRARVFGEQVHQPAVKRLLFRRVVVILIVGRGLGRSRRNGLVAPFPLSGIQGIRIVVEQPVRIAIHRRRSGLGDKARLSGRIQGLGIGAEVVVEGDIFLKDDDEMLDRCGWSPIAPPRRLD